MTDSVCGMTVDPDHAAAHRRTGAHDHDHWFCSTGCAETFDTEPAHGVRPGQRSRSLRTVLHPGRK